MNNTWEIMSLVKQFHLRTKEIDPLSREYDELEELYAQAIRLQCQETVG